MKNALALKPLVLALLSLSLPALCFANIFQYCDNEYTLTTTAFIESPYYPASYPANTACRYKLTAPIDTVIRATCEVYVDKGSSGCTTENVYVGTDGDPLLRGSENFCGQGNFTRTSIFNRFVLAYISEGSWGRFRCQFEVLPQACDCGWSVSQKIVNGVQANINEFPSMVALVDKSGSQQAAYCGGTIVSHRYIMTAAHCADVQRNPSLITAFVGDHNLASSSETLYADEYDILQIIKHPQYATTPDVVNDIAVLRTVKDILWSRGVGPICIPPTSYAYSNFDYRFVTITGWGTTSFGGPISNVLMKASLYTTTNSVCQENYQGIANVKNTQICTSSNSNQDTCQYDSGGPVIYQSQRQFQLGIISFGKPCGTGLPTIGVNTRVPSYSAWLNSVVGTGALCQKTM